MSSSHTFTRSLRSFLCGLFVALLFGGGAGPVRAQSVEAVVEQMRDRYEQQLQTVDTYIVETNLYTSYSRKVTSTTPPTYETQTRMTGENAPSFATTSTPSSAYGFQFEQLNDHATYEGTDMIGGVRTHVLRVDEPSKIDEELGTDVDHLTYYIDAEQHVPVRMVLTGTGSSDARSPEPTSVTINLSDYTTTDGLTLPHRMELQVDMNMSDQQRRQMEQAVQQMENMSEQQRRQMETMMGDQMDMMRQVMSGEPVIVEVKRVQVNVDIPDGIF